MLAALKHSPSRKSRRDASVKKASASEETREKDKEADEDAVATGTGPNTTVDTKGNVENLTQGNLSLLVDGLESSRQERGCNMSRNLGENAQSFQTT